MNLEKLVSIGPNAEKILNKNFEVLEDEMMAKEISIRKLNRDVEALMDDLHHHIIDSPSR